MVSSYQGKMKEPERRSYPLVREIMSSSFVTVKPNDDIYHAMAQIISHKISGVPVVDEHGELLGILSEKECIRIVRREMFENVTPGGDVELFMTKELITVTPEMGLAEVAELFLNFPIHKIPVIEEGKLVGIVRRRELLSVLVSFNNDRNAHLRKHDSHG